MNCACEEWAKYSPWLFAALKLVVIKDNAYGIAPLQYCPWCGKPLVSSWVIPEYGR